MDSLKSSACRPSSLRGEFDLGGAQMFTGIIAGFGRYDREITATYQTV
jgi:hypothetical protein